MTRFVHTFVTGGYQGYVNLDQVATAETIDGGKHQLSRIELRSASGEHLGYVYEHDLEEATAPVVPATPGTMATAVCIIDCGIRPTEKDVEVWREPIVAWRITEEYATPVFTDRKSSNVYLLLERSDGALCRPEYVTYRDIEDAKADLLREAQRQWDRDHKQSEPAAD